MTEMIDQLEQLSLAVGAVSDPDARRVVEAVNSRLAALVNAEVVKLYWRKEAEDGVILDPLAFVNKTQFEPPRAFQVGHEPNGVLAWVYLRRRPLWLENLRTIDLNGSLVNKVDDTELTAQELGLRARPDMDAMMVIPIPVRGDVRAVYSLELMSSGGLTVGVLELLRRLGTALSPLLWNADMYAFDLDKTSQAIKRFLESTQDFVFDSVLLERFRSGFIARPFTAEARELESRLDTLLRNRGIRARHHRQDGGQGFVIRQIMTQIKNSHFCIADVTQLNANVMIEVGMMMALNKPMLLLCRKDDRLDMPFDLNQYQYYEYELTQNSLLAWDPADRQLRPFEEILDTFVTRLPAERGFAAAMPWPQA